MDHNLFRRWMRESGYKVKDIALACGVSRSAVYNWINGEAAPNLKHLAVLHKLSHGGVQPWWFVVSPAGGGHEQQH